MQIERISARVLRFILMPLVMLQACLFAFPASVTADGGDLRWEFRDIRTGKQEPRHSAVDSQGNMILAGFQNLVGNTDDQFFTVKMTTAESGATVAWRDSYNHGTGSDQATGVAVDLQDSVIVTGHVWNGVNTDIHTIKYDKDGIKIWEHTLNGPGNGNDLASSIAVDRLNNIYIAGSTQDSAGTHYFVIKYAPTGPNALLQPEWTYVHTPGVASSEQVQSISTGRGIEENSIAVAVTGYSSNGSNLDALTLLIDSDGHFVKSWVEASNAASGSKEDRGKYVRIDKDGNVIVAGVRANELDWDIFTVKYSYDTQAVPAGWVESWKNIYSNVYEEEPNGLALDRNGNIYITGYTWSAEGSHDIYTASYTAAGALRWQKTFNSFNGNDDIATPTGIVVDELGEVYVTGYTISQGNYDFQTLKYKKDNGAELWHRQYDGPNNNNDRPVGIAIRPSNGDVLVAGWTDNTVSLASGTSSGGSVASLTDGTKSWTDGQWTGYHVMFTYGIHAGISRHIDGNDSDTLNFNLELGTPVASGENYFIYAQEDIDYTLLSYKTGLLNRPTNVEAKVESNNSVTLTWQDNSDSEPGSHIETGFNIYRRVGENGDWVRLEPELPPLSNPTVGAGVTTFNDATVAVDTRYYYYITATDSLVESYPSDDVNALTSYVDYTTPVWSITRNSPDGGNQEDYAAAIATGPDNNPVVTGKSNLAASGLDYYTLKLDRLTGQDLWSHRYNDPDQGGDEAVCVAVDKNNRAIVSGYSELFNGSTTNTNHIYTLKYPATGPPVSGNPYLWHHKYIGSTRIDDRASAIASAVDSSNNIAVVGYGKNASLNEDIYLMKYTENPSIDPQTGYAIPAWTADPFDNGGDDFPNAVAFGPNGEIYVTGYSKNVARGDFDIFTARYNGATKDLVWKDLFHGGYGDDKGVKLVVDSSGDLYVTGSATNSTGNKDMIVIKYKGSPTSPPVAERVWATPLLYNGPARNALNAEIADDFAVGVEIDPIDGKIIVGGSSMNREGEHDFTILFVDPVSGALIKNKSIHRQGSDDLATAMAIDPGGNVVLTGTAVTGGSSDSLTLKFDYDANLVKAISYNGQGNSFDETKAVAINSLGEAFVAGYATNAEIPPTADYLIYKLDAEPIMPPYPLSASPEYTVVTLSWPDLSSAEIGYTVQRKAVPCSKSLVWGDADIIATIDDESPSRTSYVDSELAHSQSYCYRVVANGANENDSRGVMKSVTTLTPVPPTGLSAVPLNTTSVKLDWSDTNAGETGFMVERCVAGNCTYQVSQPNSTTFTDTSVCSDDRATYRVMAVNHGLSLGNGQGWTRRRPIAVTDFQPSFQVKVTIPYDADTVSPGSKMNSDFSDIRFYDATARKELPYWIESKTDGSTATVWIKTATSDDIYLYYGNTSATSVSNAKTVFEFFDDFNGTTLSTDWYKEALGSATITVSGGTVTMDSTAGGGANRTWMSRELTPPYRAEARLMPTSSYQYTGWIRQRMFNAGSTIDIGFFNIYSYPVELHFGGWTGVKPADQYLHVKAAHVGYEGNSWAVVKDDGTQLYSNTYSAGSIPNYISFAAGDSSGGNGKMIVDWVFVRKYAAIDPVATAGAIEMDGAGYQFAGTFAGPLSAPVAVTLPRPGNQVTDWDFDSTIPWSGTVGTLTGTSFGSTAYYSGTKSMRLTATGATLGRYQTVSVRPGVQYTLSAYIKSSLTAGTAQCDLYSPSPLFDSPGIAWSGTTWEKKSETVTIPAGVNSVQVRCFANGSPQGSAWIDMVQLVPVPVVSGLTATRASEFRSNLAWHDNTSDETAYQVERKCLSGSACPSTPDPDYSVVPGGVLPAGATSMSDSGLVTGSTYSYRVKSVKDGTGACRWEALSDEKTVTTSNDAPVLTPTVANSTLVNLAWTDTLETASFYKLQRCGDSSCSSVLKTFPLPVIPKYYADYEVCAGTTYWYQVQGVNDAPLSGAGAGNWTRRKRLSFDTFIANHQVRVELTYDGNTGIAGNPMKTDFSDIRFYDSVDHRELPYWIETKTNGSSAVVWVKTGTRKEIDLYYGNPLATAASSGNKTFDFFEDFSGSTLDTAKWTVNDPGANVSIQNGEMVMTGGQSGLPSLLSVASLPRPLIFEAYNRLETNLADSLYFGLRNTSGTDQHSIILNGNYVYYTSLGYSALTVPLNSWQAYRIDVLPSGSVYYRGTPATTLTSIGSSASGTTTPLKVGVYGNSNRTFRMDNIRVRHYDPVDPVVTVGAVEATTGFTFDPLYTWGNGPFSTPPKLATTPAYTTPGLQQEQVVWASEKRLNLTWTDTNIDETGFEIDRCLDDQCTSIQQTIITTGSATTYQDINLTPDANYCYRVRAYKTATCGWETPSSSIVCRRTAVDPPVNTQATKQSVTSCDDVRFTDSDGTTLRDHWMRQGCNTASTLFFTKLESIPVGIKTAYLYFGNTGAASASNGATTMDFFDDFSGSSIDQTKWAITDGTGFTVSNGHLHGTNNTGRLTSIPAFNPPIYLQVRAKTTSRATNGQIIGGFYVSSGNSLGLLEHLNNIYYCSDNTCVAKGSQTPDNYLNYTIALKNSTTANITVRDMDTDQSVWAPGDVTNTVSNEKIAIGRQYDNANSGQSYATDWDWIAVRKYADPFPVSSFGDIEYGPYTIGGVSFEGRKPVNINNATTSALNNFQAVVWEDTRYLATERLVVGWTDNYETETGFDIRRCTAGPAGSADCDPGVTTDTGFPVSLGANVVTYSDLKVALGTKYCYQIKVKVTGVTTNFGGTFCGTMSASSGPSNLSATVSGSRVDLSWTAASPGFPGSYQIERCSGACDFSTSDIFQVPGTQTTWTDPSACGGSYKYRVKSRKPWVTGWSEAYSNEVPADIQEAPVPTALSLQMLNEESIKLTWNDNTTNETAWRVERRCVSGPPASPCADNAFHPVGSDLPAHDGTGSMTFTDSALVPGTSYEYRVSAVKEGTCAYSKTSEPASLATVIYGPESLVATAANSTRVDLAWTDRTSTETGFVVERCFDATCSSPTILTRTGVSSRSYVDTSVCNADAQVFYRVKAVKEADLSLSGGGVWTRRTPLTITGFQPDYPTKVVINSASFSGMQSDFRDIRFYDETAMAELPYWVETISGTTATVWVRTGNFGTINLYYGNASAQSAGSGDGVFDFFDGFDGQSIDATKWNVVDMTGFSVSGGELHGTNTTGRLATRKTFGSSTRLEVKAKSPSMPVGWLATAAGFYNSDSVNIGINHNGSSGNVIRNGTNIGGVVINYYNYLYTVIVNSGNAISQIYDLDNSAQTLDRTDTYTMTPMPVVIGRGYRSSSLVNSAYATNWDWIRVRRYVATEPTVALGTAQSSGGYPFVSRWASDSNYSNIAAAVTPNPANMLFNGGFEYDGAGWIQWAPAAATYDTTVFTDGARSLKLTVSGAAAGATQKLTVIPGAAYKLSGYISKNLSSGLAQCDVIDDPNATSLDSQGIRFNIPSETVTIPAGVSSVQIRCFIDGASPQGTANFDAIQFAPVPFTALTATKTSESSVKLDWKDTLNDETGFVIERCADDGAACTPAPGANGYRSWSLASGSTTFSEMFLVPDSTYRYRIKGTKAATCSWETTSSDVTSVVTTSTPPSGLTATPAGSNRIDLAWTRGTQGEKDVQVERCVVPDGYSTCTDFSSIGAVPAGVTTFSDSSVCNGDTYIYRVIAQNKGLTLDNGGCWGYRAPVSFTDFQSNFQVKLTVNRASYTGMRDDFRDIRFYDTVAEVELPYWIEKVTGTTATVWLKTGQNSSIVMYYGNSSATDAQNAKKVFDFFEDFNGTSLDQTVWSVLSREKADTLASTGFSLSGGYLKGTNTNGALRSIQQFAPLSVFETKAKTPVFSPNGHCVLGLYNSRWRLYQAMPSANYGNILLFYSDYYKLGALPLTDVIYSFAVKDDSNAVLQAVNFDTGAVIAGPQSYQAPQRPVPVFNIHLGYQLNTYVAEYYNEVYSGEWDWVRARKYAATEPVATVGAGASSTCPATYYGSWPVPLLSNTTQAATSVQPPPALSSVANDSVVTLSWSDTTSDEGGFRVERCTVATGDTCDFSTLDSGYPADVAANLTTVNDLAVTQSGSYCYRIKAFKAEPCGEWSTGYSNISCTDLATEKPTTLTAVANGPFRIDLTWTDVSFDEAGFEIERKGFDGVWSRIATVAASEGTGKTVLYSDTSGIEPNRNYIYRVRSYSKDEIADDFASGIDPSIWSQEGVSLQTVTTPPINISDAGGTAKISETGGAVEMSTSTPGGSTKDTFNYAKISYLDSMALDGDFDVQVDYSLPEVNLGASPDPSVLHRLARIDVKLPSSAVGSNFFFAERCYNNGGIAGHCYLARAWIDGQAISKAIATNDSTGKMRLTRTGNLAGIYVWNAGRWELLTSVAGISTAPATSIQITQFANRGGAASLRTQFDNFQASIFSKSGYSGEAPVTTPSFTPADAICPLP